MSIDCQHFVEAFVDILLVHTKHCYTKGHFSRKGSRVFQENTRKAAEFDWFSGLNNSSQPAQHSSTLSTPPNQHTHMHAHRTIQNPRIDKPPTLSFWSQIRQEITCWACCPGLFWACKKRIFPALPRRKQDVNRRMMMGVSSPPGGHEWCESRVDGHLAPSIFRKGRRMNDAFWKATAQKACEEGRTHTALLHKKTQRRAENGKEIKAICNGLSSFKDFALNNNKG